MSGTPEGYESLEQALATRYGYEGKTGYDLEAWVLQKLNLLEAQSAARLKTIDACDRNARAYYEQHARDEQTILALSQAQVSGKPYLAAAELAAAITERDQLRKLAQAMAARASEDVVLIAKLTAKLAEHGIQITEQDGVIALHLTDVQRDAHDTIVSLRAYATNLLAERDNYASQVEVLSKRAADLAKFKSFVHTTLDKMGVPTDPDPAATHAHGCRISGRLKWMKQEMARSTNAEEAT